MATKSTAKATKSEPTRDPRKDVFLIHLDQISVAEGFNVRSDFGDLESLADSIEANGVKVPLRGYKKDGIYWLVDGERRYRAGKIVEKRTGIKMRVPFLPDAKESSEEQRVIDMLICNDGKKLNPVEESEAVQRLLNFGYTEKEVRDKTGFSKTYISNLKLMQSAPKKIRDLITSNLVSATLAMKVLREEKDFTKAQQVIEGAVTAASTGDKKKITEKNIRKQMGGSGINSYNALKKSFKQADKKGLVPRQDKLELYEFAKKILFRY